jgi:hypothetical protein
MNLSEMTKDDLIELVQQLQFSLKESHQVIQQLVKDLPANDTEKDNTARDDYKISDQLSLKQQLEKHDLFKMYDNMVAADVFNGIDNTTARQNAFDTIVEVLAIEGIEINRDSLYKYFPASVDQET